MSKFEGQAKGQMPESEGQCSRGECPRSAHPVQLVVTYKNILPSFFTYLWSNNSPWYFPEILFIFF